MTSSRLRAALFSRESKGRGGSIDDQDRENLEAAEDLSAEVLHTLRDKVSASRFGTKARDGWPDILSLVVADKLDLLIVFEISRGDRTMDSWVPFLSACRDHGVLVHVTSEDTTFDPRKASDRKRLLDAGSDAELESEKISARSLKGIRGAVLHGKAHGRSAFGYDREYGPIVEGKRTFTEVRNEYIGIPVEIITRIAKLDSQVSIVRDLNERKAGDRTWTTRGARYIATNPAYIGMRRHNTDRTRKEPGELHPGNWPPASDDPEWEATFWHAQEILAGLKARHWSPPSPTSRHLLSYLMTCANCKDVDGNPATVSPGFHDGTRRYRCREGCCSIDADIADKFVVRTLLRRLAKRDARTLFSRATDGLAAAEADVAKIEQRLDQVRRLFDDDQISDTAFSRKELRLLGDLAEAQDRATRAREADVVADFLGRGEFTEQVGRPRFEAMTVPQRRELLKAVFERVTLAPTSSRLSRHATEAERLELAAERITPSWQEGVK
jgi:DNA invertase Pin-like site-specific DNA recombinase